MLQFSLQLNCNIYFSFFRIVYLLKIDYNYNEKLEISLTKKLQKRTEHIMNIITWE